MLKLVYKGERRVLIYSRPFGWNEGSTTLDKIEKKEEPRRIRLA